MNRNSTVDVIRGVAMLMVVLGHTISGSTTGYEQTFLFSVIWTLQMPLFFVISGYVTRYSRPLSTITSLWSYVKRRSLAYLVPWVVWSFLVRGIIFGQSAFLDVKHLLWNMDSGYWFLVSLWCIVMVYGISDYFTQKLGCKRKGVSIVSHVAIMALGMALLGGVGKVVGMSFLDLKLTIYYLPLFACGYVYGQIQDKLMAYRNSHRVIEMVCGVAMAVWLWMIVRYTFFGIEMTGDILVMRYVTSLCGSAAVIYCITTCCSKRGGYFSRRLESSRWKYTLSTICS